MDLTGAEKPTNTSMRPPPRRSRSAPRSPGAEIERTFRRGGFEDGAGGGDLEAPQRHGTSHQGAERHRLSAVRLLGAGSTQKSQWLAGC